MHDKIEKLKIYLLYRSHPFVIINITAWVAALLIRVYEFLVLQTRHDVPLDVTALFFRSVLLDSALWYSFFFLSSFIVLPLYNRFYKQLILVQRIVLPIFLITAFLLSTYFTITYIPLGADLFGYSMVDIMTTGFSSTGMHIPGLIVLLLCIGLLAALPFLAQKLPSPRVIVFSYYIGCLIGIPAFLGLLPNVEAFKNEREYLLAVNKQAFFIQKNYHFLSEKVSSEEMVGGTEYPLLRKAEYTDVLGNFFNLSEKKPNIVFVIVEGLGSSLVTDGTYSGFTPFIDSLARVSLYWKNFLSNSGRTFGVLPSLFGSLPFGDKGFNELGSHMPDHLSLLRLVKDNGYTTRFFYAGDVGFDKKIIFLDRQQMDLILDQSQFPDSYRKAEANDAGFTWGYPDWELFRRSMEVINKKREEPFLDVYLTLSTHEPFLPPNKEYYFKKFGEIMLRLPYSEEKKVRMTKYIQEFSSFLYVDEALRWFFSEYAQRPEYAHTIFIVTGDHRIIPIPEDTKIDRYHVPLIMFSPMLKAPKKFLSVSTHMDVTPTILSLLKERYAMNFPSMVHWIGTTIDTASEFRNVHSVPFMRTKNDISDYMDGNYFVADNQLFQLTSSLGLEPVENSMLQIQMIDKLRKFKVMNLYVCDYNKIYPFSTKRNVAMEDLQEDAVFAPYAAQKLNSDELFTIARKLAFENKFAEARVICKKLLLDHPEYYDVRTLLGRIYAWEHNYDEAREIFKEIIRRSPGYADAYSALASVELWSGNFNEALKVITTALELQPKALEYKITRLKILSALGRTEETKSYYEELIQLDPKNEDLLAFKRKSLTKK